jgi:hypothetical protein
LIYKRKIICSVHNGPSYHPTTGEILYAITENKTILAGLPRYNECWDCGEKRRAEEERKKQNKLTKTFTEDGQTD